MMSKNVSLLKTSFEDLLHNSAYDTNNDNEINYLAIYREKKWTKTIYYGIFCYDGDFPLIIRNPHIKKLFVEKNEFRLEDTLNGINLYWKGNLIKQVSKKDGYYNLFNKGMPVLHIKDDPNVFEDYKKLQMLQVFFIKYQNEKIFRHDFYSLYPQLINKKYYIKYKLMNDYDGISSIKNTGFNDSEGNRLFEYIRFDNNVFGIAYKNPFTFLYSFMIGASIS